MKMMVPSQMRTPGPCLGGVGFAKNRYECPGRNVSIIIVYTTSMPLNDLILFLESPL